MKQSKNWSARCVAKAAKDCSPLAPAVISKSIELLAGSLAKGKVPPKKLNEIADDLLADASEEDVRSD